MAAYEGRLDPEFVAEAVDAGGGVLYVPRVYDGELHGIEYVHPRPDNGSPCAGWAPVKPCWPDGWDVVQLDPLTLAPSLLCRQCGHHGFMRGARWVQA